MERGLWVNSFEAFLQLKTIAFCCSSKLTLSLSVSLSGILTKPDLVDKGTEESVVEIVHNEVIHLKKGYMIVKCRGQKEITEKVSLNEAIEREKAFFKDHMHFK